ncbi:2,3-diaminopropionate biosynthesis protein SbnB [Streptomyces sp. TRM68367]|uniref:2,3-diaminopropionate biosynthesis protein SbnB n=1 Tax=Streptomyces sp. TRM68367 TaxID=2758415 RepID=UPI00165C1057|nr:2,3-diaminopropionate biosynthesis protein SbnB [Streptomyces sp. TRM68367]MBC9726531.1 2,3-diaminopropionate biosynthesis protein SbnB [Streptomyces sp. TRM68367]
MSTDNAAQDRDFVVVPASVVGDVLASIGKEAKGMVESLYIEAAQGNLVNPDSLFLRPDQERRERIIALPAYVAGDAPAMGIKWISSFPENLRLGLPRASALIALNDVRTGFAKAILEGAQISGHRTALSAAVGAEALRDGDQNVQKLAVIGTGYISRTTLAVLADLGWSCRTVAVHDLDESRARAFAADSAEFAGALSSSVTTAPTLQEALRDADLVLFATTAVVPHASEPGWFKPGAVVLHMSLRDLEPTAMSGATHVVDEVSHALREKTSLALAVEQGTVNRESIVAVGDYLRGVARPDRGKVAIYAPFGLGSLDIALAALVLDRSRGAEGVVTVPGFQAVS